MTDCLCSSGDDPWYEPIPTRRYQVVGDVSLGQGDSEYYAGAGAGFQFDKELVNQGSRRLSPEYVPVVAVGQGDTWYEPL